MKVSHIVKVSEIIAVEPATKVFNGERIPKKLKDGAPVFALLCRYKVTKQMGLREIELEETGLLDSAIEVKVGAKNLLFECEQYVMASENSGKPNLFYRAIKLLDLTK